MKPTKPTTLQMSIATTTRGVQTTPLPCPCSHDYWLLAVHDGWTPAYGLSLCCQQIDNRCSLLASVNRRNRGGTCAHSILWTNTKAPWARANSHLAMCPPCTTLAAIGRGPASGCVPRTMESTLSCGSGMEVPPVQCGQAQCPCAQQQLQKVLQQARPVGPLPGLGCVSDTAAPLQLLCTTTSTQ